MKNGNTFDDEDDYEEEKEEVNGETAKRKK